MEKEKILVETKKYFETYINKKLSSRKYYYWEMDYFDRIDNINFKQFTLSDELKGLINEIGKNIFDDDIVFSIEENSHRNTLNIKNISKIISSYKAHKEYLKEYIFLIILESIPAYLKEKQDNVANIFHAFNLVSLTIAVQNHINKLASSEEVKNIDKIINQQRVNFIFSYLQYTMKNNFIHLVPEFIGYSKTINGEELLNYYNSHIKEKEKNELYIKEANSVINRINNLFVSKNFETKLSFLFTLSNLPSNDELRYALEALGGSKNLHFRGQADSLWVLDSSVTRDETLLNNEHNLFLDILALKPNEFLNDNSDYERLITMQHYGLPTRLLDVTRNPLIAIFFACNNMARVNNDGMVYIFKDKEFLNPGDDIVEDLTRIVKFNYDEIQKFEKVETLNNNYFIRGIAKNQRINNQSGDFIFVGLGKDKKKNENIESLVDKYLIIDYKVKKILLENLETMNIHGGSVYPELSGMSSYLENKYRK